MLFVNKKEEMIRVKKNTILTALVEMRLPKEQNIYYKASRINIYEFCNY